MLPLVTGGGVGVGEGAGGGGVGVGVTVGLAQVTVNDCPGLIIAVLVAANAIAAPMRNPTGSISHKSFFMRISLAPIKKPSPSNPTGKTAEYQGTPVYKSDKEVDEAPQINKGSKHKRYQYEYFPLASHRSKDPAHLRRLVKGVNAGRRAISSRLLGVDGGKVLLRRRRTVHQVKALPVEP